MRKSVYLAGPMTGYTLSDSRIWRNLATEVLVDSGYVVKDPCRNKEHFGDQILPPMTQKGRALVARDHHDVKTSDIILCNLEPDGCEPPERVSLGTMFELAWAHEWQKLIVLVMGPGNVHEHIFIEYACPIVVPDLSAALDYIRTL